MRSIRTNHSNQNSNGVNLFMKEAFANETKIRKYIDEILKNAVEVYDQYYIRDETTVLIHGNVKQGERQKLRFDVEIAHIDT
jgi:hypothetical protein